jgi:hypothetical protein
MSLTITIPVWPGSSSFFTPGGTSFGFFDADPVFTASADLVSKWCATRLGYPFNDIELQNIHFYTCFEEAVLEYSNQVNQFQIRDNLFLLQGAATGGNLTGRAINPTLNRLVTISKNYGTEAGSGGNLTWKTASIAISAGRQTYNLSDFTYQTSSDASKTIEIKRVFHDTPPAIVRYFDPFIGTGLGSQTLLENFGWGNYSPGVSFLMMPVYADLLRLQAIEFNDLVRKSGFSWEISNDKIKVFPVPMYDYTMYIEYITEESRAELTKKFEGTATIGDFSNAPYQLHSYSDINPSGRQWIYKYTLALAKEVLGNIRNKYSAVPIPGSEITLNGADLVAQGQTEKDALILQLRENLEAVSRSAQMTKMNTEAEDMQSQLNKIPMKVYIG